MKLYLDIFTEEEVFSDSYPIVEKYDGVVWEFKSRWVVKGGDINVDIGCGNAFGGGGEEEQGGNEEVEKVLDVIDIFGYSETSFDKPSFGSYFKGYMKRILGHLAKENPDRVGAFKTGGQAFFKWVNEHFDDITFYTPKNFDSENAIIMSYYEGEDPAPTFMIVIDGLRGLKV